MPKKGYRPAQKHKERLSKAGKRRRHSDETRNKIRISHMGKKAKEHTRLFLKRKESKRRELHKKLLSHLTLEHPMVQRNKYRGWYMWYECPLCLRDIREEKVVRMVKIKKPTTKDLERERKAVEQSLEEDLN
jgi:hypothetical protein